MDAKIVISLETLAAARDYVPLAEKEAWVAENAPKCFDRLAITADGEAQPPMYMVNTGLKSRFLMGALARLYFGQQIDAEDDGGWLMSAAQYDAWAGSHVFNQLERWKRDSEGKARAYDITADFKDLEKRFSTQISGLLAVQNDPVIRQNEVTANMVKQMPGLIEELQKMQAEKGEKK